MRVWPQRIVVLAVLLLMASLAYAVDYPKPSGSVTDRADLLSQADRDTIAQTLEALQKKSVKAMLLTIPTTGGVAPGTYVQNLSEKWGLDPMSEEGRSFVILLAVAEKRVEVAVSRGLTDVLPAKRVNQILEKEVLPVLREGRVASALYIGIKTINEKIPAEATAPKPAPSDWTAGTATPAPAPAADKSVKRDVKRKPAADKTDKKTDRGILWILAVLAVGILVLRRFNPRKKWTGLSSGPAPILPPPSPLRFGGPPRSRGLGAGRDF